MNAVRKRGDAAEAGSSGAQAPPGIDRQPLQAGGWDARLHLRYAASEHAGGSRTIVVKREHDGPLTVQKPLYPEGDRVCHQILLHTAGGLAGGDRLSIDVTVDPAAKALLTTPAATRWYRTLGEPARQSLVIRVGSKATLEWLPLESIVFRGAIARIDTTIDLERDAGLILWDIQCLGRTASGERFDTGSLGVASRLRIGGRLAWIERGSIDGADDLRTAAAGWHGHPVCATLIAASPALDRDLVQALRAIEAPHALAGVTTVDDVLIVRYLGGSIAAARDHLLGAWRILRPTLIGVAPNLPRIWAT